MDSTEYAAAVANQIREAIDSVGETQVSISEKTGIPRTTLQRRLVGDGIHPFTMREVKEIALVLGTTAKDLATVYETETQAA